jgi:hypothetical protein
VITLLPAYHETIVLPGAAMATFTRLSAATSGKAFRQSNEKDLFFIGWVKETRFRISLRVQRANHFLPLVIGVIEPTSNGSILFIDYVLFPTTRVLLTLWTILLILGSAVGAYQSKNILFILGGLGIIVLIYAIAWSNFSLHLKSTRESLHRAVL